MTRIQRIWDKFFEEYPIESHTPLFETDGLTVKVHEVGNPLRLSLERSSKMIHQMKRACSQIIDSHENPRTTIDGLIYCMYTLDGGKIKPWYIGKAGRVGKGTDGNLSANINTTESGPFGRWGYRYAYHIGDLSATVFGYKDKIQPRYVRWRDALFDDYEQLLLNEHVYLWIKVWDRANTGPWGDYGPTSLSFLEYQLIGLASAINPELLNSEGASFGPPL